jgi:hypothetical protein
MTYYMCTFFASNLKKIVGVMGPSSVITNRLVLTTNLVLFPFPNIYCSLVKNELKEKIYFTTYRVPIISKLTVQNDTVHKATYCNSDSIRIQPLKTRAHLYHTLCVSFVAA